MELAIPSSIISSYLKVAIHRISKGVRSSCSEAFTRPIQYNVLFYGSDKFSIETLKLLNNNYSLNDNQTHKIIKKLHVVSGESSLVMKFSRQNSIQSFNWPYVVPDGVYDVGVVVSFGHLIPKESIEACKYGIINVHGSLLPRWRGPSPIHHAILSGDEVTGVTIMKIVANKFDVGSILAKKEYHIPSRGTTSSVYTELSRIGAELLFDTLAHLEERLKSGEPQPNEGVTKAPKAKKIHGLLNFTKMSSVEVDRRVRAFTGLIDVYANWPLKSSSHVYLYEMIDPLDMDVAKLDFYFDSRLEIGRKLNAGSIFYHKRRKILCFKCSDGKWVGFASVKMVGKRRMSSAEFYNGFIANHCKRGLIALDLDGKLVVDANKLSPT